MAKGSFNALIDEAKKHDSYWTECAILDFTSELHSLMESKGVSKADLAKKVGTSQAYITKVFSGNANFTIQSMVKFVRALDGKLHIHVDDKDTRIRWIGSIDGGKMANEESTDKEWFPQREGGVSSQYGPITAKSY